MIFTKKLSKKVEIKNLKYSDFASEETYCFEATIYIDGVKNGLVSNDGRGGSHRYDDFGAEKTLNEIGEEFDKSNKAKTSDDVGMCAEIIINELVMEALCLKDYKKAIKGYILFMEEGKNSIFKVKKKAGFNDENLKNEAYLSKAKESLKCKVILNALSLEDGFGKYAESLGYEFAK